MPKKWFKLKVIGRGTPDDPYRPRVGAGAKGFVAHYLKGRKHAIALLALTDEFMPDPEQGEEGYDNDEEAKQKIKEDAPSSEEFVFDVSED